MPPETVHDSTETTAHDPAPGPPEKPRNGLAGLKHWRHDIVAGLLVSLISLPLSLGIAVASGAPPIAGLVSAIIAGLLMPFLGGSYVTISGPAAGLAPVLFASMTALGRGDRAVGYPLLLGVITIVGAIQIVLSLARAARFSAIFPSAVVEGMLASIGLMIIAKQLPHLIGHPYHAHEFFEYLIETPSEIPLMNVRVFVLGMTCLILLLTLNTSWASRARKIPPQLTVVVVGVILGQLLGLGGKSLIEIPDNVLKHGFVLPNFRGLFADHAIWGVVAVAVLTLTMVDGVESLATVQAVDKIDPFRRKSDPDRVLLAMGVSNIASSLGGGLTIIPGGVKSKACIVGGGKTLWANFSNAVFLILFLFVARPLINLIPYSALAAILIHTGYKMCEPRLWRHIARIGREQLALFTLTIVVTLLSDLLIGILAGIAAKLLLNLAFTARGRTFGQAIFGAPRLLAELFRDPVRAAVAEGNSFRLTFNGPLVCFNTMPVNRALAAIPPGTDHVYLEFEEGVTIIDHTSCENLIQYGEAFEHAGRGEVQFVNMDLLDRLSEHGACTRIRRINRKDPMTWHPAAPMLGFQIDPFSPMSAAFSLRDSAREAAAFRVRTDPVHAAHPKAALVRLGMVPVERFLHHPDGELAMIGLVAVRPLPLEPVDDRVRPIM